MLLSTLALSISLLQNNTVSVIYTGVPSSPGSTVSMMTHDSKTVLSSRTATSDSLSYLKNLSDKPASITVSIPVEGENVNSAMPNQVAISATVDGQPVTLTKTTPKIVATEDLHKRASGILDDSYKAAYTFQMNFVGRAAHSLKIHSSTPLGHGGLDGALRIFAYVTTGASGWDGPLGQLNISVRYTTRNVFQIYQALPQGGWQTGPTGSFFKELNYKPAGSTRVYFIYYPGGFEKLGTGGG